MTAKTEKPNADPKNTPEPAAKKLKGEARGVRLDDDLQKEADRACAAAGIPLPELIRDALRAHLVNPARQHEQLLRSVAITRSQVESAKAKGAMPVGTAEELLEKLNEFEAAAQGGNPGRKRNPFRIPSPLTLLGLVSKDAE